MARTAVVAGVGPGLGESIARKFAREGCRVALFARTESYVEELASELDEVRGGEALAVPTDLSDVEAIREGFQRVREAFGPVDVLVNHAANASWKGIDQSVEEFEAAWAVGGRGAFVSTKEAVADMREAGEGTVIFTGATSSVRGRGGALGFCATKFAARGMAQSLADELGDEGIHVAHVVIDGQIHTPGVEERYPDRGEETFLDPDEMADTYWRLVEQDVDTMEFEVHVTNGNRSVEFL